MESVLRKDSRSPGVDRDGVVGQHQKRSGVSFLRTGQSTERIQETARPVVRQVARWMFRLTHWETWDWRIKYVFISPAWFWYCLKARSPWFFTASNPGLAFGGFDGESKWEMYAQLPPARIPRSIFVSCESPLDDVEILISRHGLTYPFAAKPDVGKMGYMFRLIHSSEEWKQYHFKVGCDYIIQEFISWPLEVSVFYYRLPGAKRGTITGFIRKDRLEVVGDGRSTLLDLMGKYEPVRFRMPEMKAKHKDRLHHVLPDGERYFLSPALNLSRGGTLVSLEQEKDERLLKIFDELSLYTGNLFYGRYDIKCASIEGLKQGEFCILEYNGSGAEAHHVYGNGYNFFQACSILIFHWHMLYRISRLNHKRGVDYWPFKKGWRFLKQTGKHMKRLAKADATTLVAWAAGMLFIPW